MVQHHHLLYGCVMTSITFSNGKAVMRGNAIATGTECCCGGPICQCGLLALVNMTFRITFNFPWGSPACIGTPLEIPVDRVLECENGTFSLFFELDTALCTGPGTDMGCGSVIAFLTIVGECDCTNTADCEVEIVGWEEVSCDGGIANVEIV